MLYLSVWILAFISLLVGCWGYQGKVSSIGDDHGTVGLRNLGNTCFMNSVLQSLSNTRMLLEYCIKDNYHLDINKSTSNMKGQLMTAYAKMMDSMWKSKYENVVSPSAFKSQIQKFASRFMGYNQQDAHEFLIYLLEGLHEDVNRVAKRPKPIIANDEEEDKLSDADKAREYWKRYLAFDNSKIVDVFVGQLKSTLRCTTCDYASVTFDPFWDISLPIPKRGSDVKLEDCFKLFTQEEVLDDDERPTCARCKARRRCTKSFTIHKFPKVLVLHLKRFSQGNYFRNKLSTHVDFPTTRLDLHPFAAERNSNCIYNLYAVSNHSGTTYSGHYTATCKHPYSGQWHDFNDTRVSQSSAKSAVTQEAYVLFYELASETSRL